MINRVIINGYLGKNPEVKKTNSGKSVCNFSICQSRKDQSGNQISKWFHINAWEKTAEFLGQYCKTGDMILVEGHMDYREYDVDGQRRTTQDIIADTITFERQGNNHDDTQQTYAQPVYSEPQRAYTQPSPSYSQTSMTSGANVPSDFGQGLDIGSDDLPF